ncbi:hypothetical protein QK289_13255 [Exiguobacterium antarcticum]|uniref:PrgI family protein n=1 Tax=Exiguobacterium antarcticum TaxID=132920 RepID=A0ABT6R565_9BACL|nr:hypothetical protein [Exiguobacterium antarcticum]MDI3235978.1 hypothetical protein [Exiguobacterium antarcticum]
MNFDLEKMMNQQIETKYIIPKNIKARFEIFGIGLREIIAILVAGIVGLIIVSIVDQFIDIRGLIKLLVILAFGGISFLLVVEDPREGVSIIKFVQYYKDFLKKPRKYLYSKIERGE